MSHDWVGYVIKESPYSGSAFAVHMVLAHHASKDTGECYPHQETIAEEARVSLSSVEKAIKRLCDDGYLVRWRDGYKHYYRLLVSNSNPYPSTGEPVTQYGLTRNPVRVHKEPSENCQLNQPHPTPSGPEEEAMPIGSLNDDDEMPEYGAPPPPKKERFEREPRGNTHRWAVYQFERELVKANCGRDYNLGLLHRTIKTLHEDGYTYDEIVLMIKTFFVKYGQEVRTKRKEVDPSRMFAAKVSRLKVQMESTIRGIQSGETTMDRTDALNEALRKRMGLTTEESA